MKVQELCWFFIDHFWPPFVKDLFFHLCQEDVPHGNYSTDVERLIQFDFPRSNVTLELFVQICNHNNFFLICKVLIFID